MSEDYAAVARGLKQQAEAALHANDQTSVIRASAIAGLAQVSALLAIHEEIQQLKLTIREVQSMGVGIYMQNEDYGSIHVDTVARGG